ncbi:hypothetical protein O1611_g242 [Lasiodiplodia mahajangana]|uniref:Uncharacterized protein n=1 Tax=Lasiodiplodia mahajangana TaxID=1108764 RepID=A0ACC2K130_9PEZI|nr:hypothetical protein O1611_g242 [Lasiodiplodia mahajangana]
MAFSLDPSILETHPGAKPWGIPAAQILADQSRYREIMRINDQSSNRAPRSPPAIGPRIADQPRAKETRLSALGGEGQVRPAERLPSISEWYKPPSRLPSIREALLGVALSSTPDPEPRTCRESSSCPRLPSISEWYPPRVLNSIVASPIPELHENFGITITVTEPPSLQTSLLNTPTSLGPTPPSTVSLSPPGTWPRRRDEGLKRKRTLGDDDDNLWDSPGRRKIPRTTTPELIRPYDDEGRSRPSAYDGAKSHWYQEERPRLPTPQRDARSRCLTV